MGAVLTARCASGSTFLIPTDAAARASLGQALHKAVGRKSSAEKCIRRVEKILTSDARSFRQFRKEWGVDDSQVKH